MFRPVTRTTASLAVAPTEHKSPDSIHTLMLYRISRSTSWIAFFALMMAIAGGAGGYFLWNQQNLMQDQLDILQDLSDKVQKSFESSRVQSEALPSAMQAVSEAMDR